ncbi:MAG: hypothetical protein VX341_11370 [Bdellovibrionota bacterium]|nr:hypothetical protein [Bdellovibrionota bacterium]
MNKRINIAIIFTLLLSFNLHAVCTDSDISGCEVDMDKCLELAQKMGNIDQQNMIRFQCLKNYQGKISKVRCEKIANDMYSVEQVERALLLCRK